MSNIPVIWIISNQQWPRAYLRAELIERGFDAIGFIELADALAAILRSEYERPRLIVLELRGLPLKSNELYALERLTIPTIALGGAVELAEKLVKEFKWAAVMPRPFTLGDVADMVENLLGD